MTLTPGQMTITQYEDNISYCRRYNGASFDDYDALSLAANASACTLWADSSDWLYVGKASTFNHIGFKMAVAGEGYGDFTVQYSSDGAYPITAVNTIADTFTICADVAAKFTDGSYFTVSGSTGNDGTYICDGNATAAGTYNITAVNQGAKTFTVNEDLSMLNADDVITISGSTGNDGDYTVASTSGSGPTDIVVDEAIPDATADGSFVATTVTVFEDVADATVDGDISTIWTVLDILFNNTVSFSQSGYLLWSIPGDWALRTVDSVSAYWIRATQDALAPTTPAQAYHLLRHVNLNEPLHVDGPNRIASIVYRDINRTLHRVDTTSKVPERLRVEITQIAFTMGNMQCFIEWEERALRLYIEDASRTTPLAMSTDAYYRTMQGMLTSFPGVMKSPYKMGLTPGGYYPLEFEIDTVVTLSSLCGVTA